MRTEDRLKEILARQAAAAKVEKDSEAEAKIVAGQLNELREAVTQNWPVRRAHIAAFVAKLNSQMKKNGHQLFVMESDSVSSHTGLEVDKMELGFEPKTRSHKKLLLSNGFVNPYTGGACSGVKVPNSLSQIINTSP